MEEGQVEGGAVDANGTEKRHKKKKDKKKKKSKKKKDGEAENGMDGVVLDDAAAAAGDDDVENDPVRRTSVLKSPFVERVLSGGVLHRDTRRFSGRLRWRKPRRRGRRQAASGRARRSRWCHTQGLH